MVPVPLGPEADAVPREGVLHTLEVEGLSVLEHVGLKALYFVLGGRSPAMATDLPRTGLKARFVRSGRAPAMVPDLPWTGLNARGFVRGGRAPAMVPDLLWTGFLKEPVS